MSEDRVLHGLRALAESDCEWEAPPAVEASLLGEFRARRHSYKWRWIGGAAIAAGVVLAVSLPMNYVKKPVVSVVPPVIAVPRPVAPAVVAAAPTARRVVRKKALPQGREVVTEFFPLIDSAPPSV